MRTLPLLVWWHQGTSRRSCLYQILPGTDSDSGWAGFGSSFFFVWGLHKNRGREGPAVTFRGCVAPALPWVQPPAFLCFVLSWGLFLSPLLPQSWLLEGFDPPFSGDTGSPSAGFCDELGVRVRGTREELSAVRSRGIWS